VISFFCQLVTSAAAANRLVRLEFDDNASNTLMLMHDPVIQAASLTTVYTFARGINSTMSASLREVGRDIPNNVWLGPGFVIRTITGNVQGGDQYSRGTLLVREWGV